MFGLGRSSTSIYQELVAKALSIASIQEIGDSSIKELNYRTFNPIENDGASPIAYFRNRVGKMSDGMHIYIPTADYNSYNILSSVVLSYEEYGEVSLSSSRFGNNKDSIYVFVNGKKVPDSAIFLYITDSNTNIIIAKKYFESGVDNALLIEKREFNYYKYGGTHVAKFNNNTIYFTIGDHRNLTLNDVTAMIFLEGEYLVNIISNMTLIGDVLTINFNRVLIGDLEVSIDSSAKYSATRSISNTDSQPTVPFYIDDQFIDPLYGPVNKNNCQFFVNGLRISNHDVNQVARLNYELQKSISRDDKFTILFTDNGIIDERSFKIFGDDYFLYNFLGSVRTTKGLLGFKTNTPFDDNIDFKSTLNSNDYSISKIVEIIEDIDKIENVQIKIQKLLIKFPNLLKTFLEMFASSSIIKNIEYNGIDPTVTIGIDTDYYADSKVIRIIVVNGLVAKIEDFVTNNTKRFWNSVVDSKWFHLGTNEVEIIESLYNCTYEFYKVVTIDRYETTDFVEIPVGSNYDYRAVLDVFGSINSITDFKLLAITKKSLDPDGIYFDSSEYGFKVVEVSTKMISDNKIHINFGQIDPRIDMLIVMSLKHHTRMTVTIDELTESYDSLFNTLYCGIERYYDNNEYHFVKVPIIQDGGMVVFNKSDGVRMFIGIDFLFKSPSNVSNLRNSGIIFRKPFSKDDEIEVVFLPEYTSTKEYPYISADHTLPNKYALLYLGNLKFPFSSNYVKVFANNKSLTSKNIDILSNKLIRLFDIQTVCMNHLGGDVTKACSNCINGGSLFNIFIEFNFRASFSQLQPFISEYKDSEFEIEVSKIFNNYNISDEHVLYSGSIIDYYSSRIYATFDPGVDSNSKTPNTIIREVFSNTKYNIYLDAYLRWFMSDRCNHIFKSFEDIPEKILKEIEVFKDDTDYDNRDVVIRPESREIISDIEVATKFDWYPGFTYYGTVRNFLECCVENGLSIQECYDRYEEFKQSNRVYKRDLLPINAILPFEGEDIIIGRGPTFKR